MILVRKRFPNDFQEKKISDCVLQSRMQQFILMGLCNISLTEVYLKPSQTSTMDLFCESQKRSIVYVRQASKYASVVDIFCSLLLISNEVLTSVLLLVAFVSLVDHPIRFVPMNHPW